jgi:hypothetical protein
MSSGDRWGREWFESMKKAQRKGGKEKAGEMNKQKKKSHNQTKKKQSNGTEKTGYNGIHVIVHRHSIDRYN